MQAYTRTCSFDYTPRSKLCQPYRCCVPHVLSWFHHRNGLPYPGKAFGNWGKDFKSSLTILLTRPRGSWSCFNWQKVATSKARKCFYQTQRGLFATLLAAHPPCNMTETALTNICVKQLSGGSLWVW